MDPINMTERQARTVFCKSAIDFDVYCLFLERIKKDYDIHVFINGRRKLSDVANLKPLTTMRKKEGKGVGLLTREPGINIVVYDPKSDVLVDSVRFDLLAGAVWRNNEKIDVGPYVSTAQWKEPIEEMRTKLKQGNAMLEQNFFKILDSNGEDRVAARKQFHSSIPKATGALRLKQLVLLYNATLFDKLCKRLGIQYSIFYGTLLGAWRSGGFIPWDDDIDVIVFREAFQKLWEYSDSEQFDDLPQIKFGVNDTRNLGIGRFRVIETGFSFDVFPYTYSDSGTDTHCDEMIKFKKAHHREIISRMGADFRKDRQKLYEAWDDIFDKASEKFNPNGEGKYVIGSLGGGNTYLYPTDILFPLSEIDFEGFRFSAPNDIEAINALSFNGDPYALPPDVYQQHKSFEKVTYKKLDTAVKAIENLDSEYYQKYLQEEWERLNR